jgi:hypothetical protein
MVTPFLTPLAIPTDARFRQGSCKVERRKPIRVRLPVRRRRQRCKSSISTPPLLPPLTATSSLPQYASSDEETSQDPSDGLSRRTSTFSGGDDSEAHLAAGERAMTTLQDLHSTQASAWKRALKHKSGCVVFVSKEKSYAGPKKNGKGYFAPVFKGELDIKGFDPSQVFGVVGTRKLWDDWYKEVSILDPKSLSRSR